MPVNAITYQPATAQLLAAYRPIVYQVQATATGGGPLPPYVVADIYIADVYYKSIIRTAPESQTSLLSVWEFDISDALQEYLAVDLAAIDNTDVLQAVHASAKVFVRFRASDIDADGFTQEEATRPVQATRNTAAVSGTGLQSNSFFTINATLQHEDNQNLEQHLNAYKLGAWKPDAFPLTHRNNYKFCNGDSDHYPVIFTGACLDADLVLNYRLKGSGTFNQATAITANSCDPIDYSVSVTGNKIDIVLDDPLGVNESVVVQYKKQADSVWIDAGTFSTDSFFFYVTPADPDDYDVRVIHFCNACLSASPVADVFTLDGTVASVGWRGINPSCEVITIDPPVYVVLELRNNIDTDINTPDNINPITRTQTSTWELWAMFFSDPTHLTPVSLTQLGMNFYIKTIENRVDDFGTGIINTEVETLATFTEDLSADNEVLLGTVESSRHITNYSTYPTISSETSSTFIHVMYPDHQLIGGNTGDSLYATLEEYNTVTGDPTGVTKPNDSGDPDYIPPYPDGFTCPAGPDATRVTYGAGLEVAKVEMSYGVTDLYAETYTDTDNGGHIYIFPLPKNTDITITVKARNLSVGPGFVKARVTYVDGSGTVQISEFSVTNNVETTLPQTFQNVTNIAITQF